MRVGDPDPGHLLGVSPLQVTGRRSGAACPGVLPVSLLLMARALHSEGVLGGKDVVFKRNPDGLVNFRFFFFLSTVGRALSLSSGLREEDRGVSSRLDQGQQIHVEVGKTFERSESTRSSGPSGFASWREPGHCPGLPPAFLEGLGAESLPQSSWASLISDLYAV